MIFSHYSSYFRRYLNVAKPQSLMSSQFSLISQFTNLLLFLLICSFLDHLSCGFTYLLPFFVSLLFSSLFSTLDSRLSGVERRLLLLLSLLETGGMRRFFKFAWFFVVWNHEQKHTMRFLLPHLSYKFLKKCVDCSPLLAFSSMSSGVQILVSLWFYGSKWERLWMKGTIWASDSCLIFLSQGKRLHGANCCVLQSLLASLSLCCLTSLSYLNPILSNTLINFDHF